MAAGVAREGAGDGRGAIVGEDQGFGQLIADDGGTEVEGIGGDGAEGGGGGGG
jgi:hypothetical protein